MLRRSIELLTLIRRTGNARRRSSLSRVSVLFGAALLLAASPAKAASLIAFGQDLAVGSGGPFTLSDFQRSSFIAALVDPATEDFESFTVGATGTLDLSFENGVNAVLESGKLNGAKIVSGTHLSTFPISGSQYAKGRTPVTGNIVFNLVFDHPVVAFGFYATGYSSCCATTELTLQLTLSGGGTRSYLIQNSTASNAGNAFYFGVIDDPFVAATLLNDGSGFGDGIGFDDFTVAHSAIPEPSTAGLLLLGMTALALAGAKQRQPA